MRHSATSLSTALCALLALACAPALAQKAPAGQPAISGTAFADAMTLDIVDQLRIAQDRHWHKGEYRHIINLARIVVAGDPKDTDTYSNAGWLLWSLDMDAEAVAFYKQGIADNPDTYFMYDELGGYYVTRKKDPASAKTYLEKAVAKPDCPARTLHTLALCYEKLGELDKARNTWRKASERTDNPAIGAAKMHLERITRQLNDR